MTAESKGARPSGAVGRLGLGRASARLEALEHGRRLRRGPSSARWATTLGKMSSAFRDADGQSRPTNTVSGPSRQVRTARINGAVALKHAPRTSTAALIPARALQVVRGLLHLPPIEDLPRVCCHRSCCRADAVLLALQLCCSCHGRDFRHAQSRREVKQLSQRRGNGGVGSARLVAAARPRDNIGF
jgi:hypothetical protein